MIPSPPSQGACIRLSIASLLLFLLACSSGGGPSNHLDARGHSSLLPPLPRSPESVGISTEALGRLNRVLEGYVDREQLPGYQLLVAREGEVVHERIYGQLDREAGRPLESDAIYRIYSMSKVITGVATMIAYEQGSFLLNDPVSKYLPALADMSVMEWNEDGTTRLVPAEREITILDLLRHTSGIGYHFTVAPPLRDLYVNASLTPGIRPLPEASPLGALGQDPDATLEDMVERLGEIPLAIQPGSAWLYGINMDVLGRLIEVTTNQSFPDFLEENIFGPLGMQDTAFFVPEDKVDRFAALYMGTPEGGMKLMDTPQTSSYLEVPKMPGGGAGLVSTANDYMRFALMLAGGGQLEGLRLLSRKTVKLMMTNHLSPIDFGVRPLTYSAGGVYANGGLGVGFGLTGSVITAPALTGLPISMGTYSWGGAASTVFWIDPEEDVAVVFMTQLLISNTYPLRAHLIKGVNAALLD